ncbi:MAG: CheR family methyltransferase [Gammaproteobacteria bacterium]
MEMNLQDFKFIQQFLAQSCGIVLSDSKQYLVRNRLAGLLERYRMASFNNLIAAMQAGTSEATKLKADVIEAMTTNETFWFRDDGQFSELKETLLPEFLAKKRGVRIWSAACSSGQEPYTISMCVEDAGNNHHVKIIGTDISENVLNQARLAVYSGSSLARGIDTATRNRFFHSVEQGYRLNPEITGRVRFQQFNLLKPFMVLGRFDVIFCRNVLIYFSDEIKRDILNRMAQILEPGGVLFLSSTEVMPAGVSGYEPVRGKRSRYYKKPA